MTLVEQGQPALDALERLDALPLEMDQHALGVFVRAAADLLRLALARGLVDGGLQPGQRRRVERRPRADEGAAPDMAPDAALRLQHLEGAAHRAAANPDLLGELALGGELLQPLRLALVENAAQPLQREAGVAPDRPVLGSHRLPCFM